MKRLTSTLASAALCLSLCFGASASSSIPVKMAPGSAQPGVASAVSRRVIIIIVVLSPQASQGLEHVDQAAEFDRTN